MAKRSLQIKEKINSDILYTIVWIMADCKNYFSKNPKIGKESRERAAALKPKITCPEISEDGLERRINTLRIFIFNFFYFGLLFGAPLIFLASVFGLPLEIICIVASIGFYLTSTACIFGFRTGFAEADLRRYKRMSKIDSLEGFKINRNANPRIYDLIPGVFMAMFFYFFLLSMLS